MTSGNQQNPLAQPLAQEGRKPAISEPPEGKALDPDLAMILDRWPILPEVVRAGIAAMVKASAEKESQGTA